MDIEIAKSSDDDPGFIEGLTRLVSEAVRQYKAAEVFLIRTDNWFDVKWLGFAGKSNVGFDSGVPSINSEVRAFWKSGTSVTIPPFVPHRIVEETHLKYENGSLVGAGKNSRRVHPPETMNSAINLTNRVLDHSPSALFIWFSSKSARNGRASVMLYRTYEQKVGGWYVCFVRTDGWRVDRVKNKNRSLIERLFRSGNSNHREQGGADQPATAAESKAT